MLPRLSSCASATMLLLASGGLAAADDAAIIRSLLGIDPGAFLGQRARPHDDWVLEGPVRRPRATGRRPSPRQGWQAASQPSDPSDETVTQRKEIQRRLKLLGYLQGRPDGVFGTKSRAAIARFQRSIDEPADGKLTETQVTRLYEMTGDTITVKDGSPEGFPELGPAAPARAAEDSNQGFPALAAHEASSDTDAAFPALGGGRAGDAAGLPPLAKPQEAGLGGEMPDLTATASAGETAAAGFPSLASPAAVDAPANPLPPLAPDLEATDELPALAKTNLPAELPALTTPTQEGDLATVDLKAVATPATDYPGLAAAPPSSDAAEELRDRSDLAAELANVAGSSKVTPQILGIALGSDMAEIDGKLKTGGFASCSVANRTVSCTKSTPSLDDRIEARGLENGALWSLKRRIEFKQPIDRDYILSRLADSMPTLVKDDDGFLASRPGCTKTFVRTLETSSKLDEMETALDRKERVENDNTFAVALRCPLFFDVLVTPDKGDVASIDIRFFDGTPLVRREVARRAEQSTRESEKRKTIDADLKL